MNNIVPYLLDITHLLQKCWNDFWHSLKSTKREKKIPCESKDLIVNLIKKKFCFGKKAEQTAETKEPKLLYYLSRAAGADPKVAQSKPYSLPFLPHRLTM